MTPPLTSGYSLPHDEGNATQRVAVAVALSQKQISTTGCKDGSNMQKLNLTHKLGGAKKL